uniref:Hfaza2M n=1 Tax=Hypoxylon fragiforme TaxID=63214 RepID=A0A7G6J4F2_9PEZI|nr:Hfaza2M [Hypoxylon fragiforme]
MFFDTTLQRALVAAAAVATAPNVTELFGPHLSSRASIYLASDSNYTTSVTQRWTDYAAPAYIATIQPATVHDVQNIIPFLVTGGGHGVSVQLANLKEGIQVDLGKFNNVTFDSDTQLLTVGGAAKFSQLIDPLYELGYQFPLGTAYCVGVVGATLGAGVSANQGYMGLLLDLLEEVQVVTAAGDVVTASRSTNEDLFWALRGAGANFGIITSATYKVPRAVNGGKITNINYLFPGTKSREVFTYLASLDDEMPAPLALNIGTLVEPNSKQLVLLVNANFAGPVEAALPHLAPLKALNPLRYEVLSVAWPDVFSTSYFGIEDTKACGRNQHVNMRSIGGKSTDPDVIVGFLDELERFTKANPDVLTAMMVHRFATEKVLEVPDAESAYPHRELKMHIQLESEYDDRRKDSLVDAFLHSARHNLTSASGFDEPVVYVNFAHGDEGPAAWYGARNLARLSELKRKWDPRGLFNYYNAVPMGVSDGEL